ncbi:MAG TPA: hypothetical protein VIK53_00235 [Verrucomicrobiae bacterium]
MFKKSIIAFVIAVLAGCGLIAVIPLFHLRSTTAQIPPWMENLKIIQMTKRQWALDYDKTTNDIPTWDDLKPYDPDWMTNNIHWTNGRPVFPDGGIYTIGRVGVPPTCLIDGFRHSLPQ